MLLENFLSYILRSGLYLALLIASYGGLLLFLDDGYRGYDFTNFHGVNHNLADLPKIFKEASHNHPLAVIQLGLLLLILIPTVRVATCLVMFIYQKDVLYCTLSLVVLTILLVSLL